MMPPESPDPSPQSPDSSPSWRQPLDPVLRGVSGGWVSTRTLMIGFGVGIALTLGAGLWLSQQASGEQEDSGDAIAQTDGATGAARAVTVAPAQPAQIRQFLDATGTVEARELVPVKSQASGLQVIRVLVDEGQTVQANQPMAVLDDSVLRAQWGQARGSVIEAQAALDELRRGTRTEVLAQAREAAKQAQARVVQAEADWDLAKQRLGRNQSLYDDRAISEDRLEEVKAQARSAEAAKVQAEAALEQAMQRFKELQKGARPEDIAQAEARLFRAQSQVREWEARITQARVVASATGVVADRQVKVGELIRAEQDLFSIIEAGVVELYLMVPETQIRRIQVGLPVRVTSDSDPSLRLVGRVREIDPVIDPESRQATVKVALPPTPGLRTGMFLRGEVATSLNQGLTVPTAAVLPQGDGSSIAFRVAQDQTVTAVPVTTGEVLPGGWVEVKEGLQPGDAVVVQGAPYLKDGDRVQISGTVTPPQAPAPRQSPPATPTP